MKHITKELPSFLNQQSNQNNKEESSIYSNIIVDFKHPYIVVTGLLTEFTGDNWIDVTEGIWVYDYNNQLTNMKKRDATQEEIEYYLKLKELQDFLEEDYQKCKEFINSKLI